MSTARKATAKRRDRGAEPMATPEEVAACLRIKVQTLYCWRHQGEGPPAQKVGKFLRWYWDDVHEWIESQNSAA